MCTTPLLENRTQVTNYGKDLFRVCGVEFAKTTEMQQQVSGAFLFGIVFTTAGFISSRDLKFTLLW